MHDVDGNLHFISRLWTWHEPLSLSHPVGKFGFYLMILVLTHTHTHARTHTREREGLHINTSFPSLLQGIPVLHWKWKSVPVACCTHAHTRAHAHTHTKWTISLRWPWTITSIMSSLHARAIKKTQTAIFMKHYYSHNKCKYARTHTHTHTHTHTTYSHIQ